MEERLTKLLFELSNRSAFVTVLESIVAVAIIVFSIVGNILVLLALYRSPRLKKPSYLYIVSLAVSDIIMSTTAMPFSWAALMLGRWCFGDTICWLQASLANMLGCTSLVNMALIAVVRFLKVVHPTKHRKIVSVQTIVFSIFAAWLLTGAIPLSFYLSKSVAVFHPGHVACTFDFKTANKIVLAFIATFGTSIPYQIMFLCYFKVWRFIKNHNNQMSTSLVNVEELNLTRLLTFIVGAFTICFIPPSVMTAIDAFYKQFVLPREVYFAGTIMIALTSCINPLIYGALNGEFRREFVKLLHGNGRIVPSNS